MSQRTGLAGVALNVVSPEKLADFYVQYLGMTVTRTNKELRLHYDKNQAYIAFRQSPSLSNYEHAPNDTYWKISITLPDIDMAYSQLKQREVKISKPKQFENIGYICHLTDPQGFQIELLQHTFENEEKSMLAHEQHKLGGGARIGLITLRTNDIYPELDHYIGTLGMRLLSIQPLEKYDFDLYFFGFSKETPPNPVPTSVQNRPWLWQRPYTILEIQHRYEKGASIKKTNSNSTGFTKLIFK
ncbi:MAG: VOC family protein [Hyphomicrobiales bacterium]